MAFFLLVGVVLGSVGGTDQDHSVRYAPFAHVRPVDHTCAAWLRRGIEASPTLRAMVARIQSSDIIVYLECGQRLRTGVVGITRLAVHTGRYRYVRVSIGNDAAGQAAIATLGHELFHVTELAAAPHVIDGQSVRELYMTLGHQTCSGDPPCFDTADARRAGDRVLRELRSSGRE
jgi:hypothetical protein